MAAEIRSTLDGLVRADSTDVSIRHHQYMILSYFNNWIRTDVLEHTNGILLDLGCGAQPYRKVLEPKWSRYIAADVAIANNTKPDLLFEPGKPVPLEDNSVDTILSTQVLEHVRDFNHYMAECNRLLVKGGHLIISAPMQWKHHEVPYDFWRFTKFGLSEVLERNNFEIIHIKQAGGTFVLIGQILLNYLVETKAIYNKKIFNRTIDYTGLYMIINKISLWLDKKYPSYDDTLNWMFIAKKL
jgi:SAM-dependent methyltransferase